MIVKTQRNKPIIILMMNERFNYDDNIFFLNTIIKTLDNGFFLDIDANYFTDKIVEDLFFIDRCIRKILESLNKNQLMIRRIEYLRNLLRSVNLFLKLISDAKNSSIYESFLHYHNQIEKLEHEYENFQEKIQDLIERSSETEEEDLVSQDEYRFLLQEEENEEE